MSNQTYSMSNETQEKPDTYHTQDKLINVAINADRLSWLFLALTALVGLIIVYFLYYCIKLKFSAEQILFNLPTYIVPFLLGGFFWIVTKLISEGIYLFMDIEDNTRKVKE